jgi:hypothetical protein
VTSALAQPEHPIRGTVGSLVRIEVSALVVEADGTKLIDLSLIVHLPVMVAGSATPPGWPGVGPSPTMAELATAQDSAALDLDYPGAVATPGGSRTIDKSTELAIVVRGWVPMDG